MSRAKNPSIAVLKRNTGAERIGHKTGTVASALKKRVATAATVAELKAFDVGAGFQVRLQEAGRGGVFTVKTGTPPNDPFEAWVIVLDNGNYAEREIGDTVKASWWQPAGDGVADDTARLQAAIDLGKHVDYGRDKIYGVTRSYNGTDRYALNITTSNTRHYGAATFKRLNPIVNDADTYTVFLIGAADDNGAAATDDVTIEGLAFEGSDTRHSVTGNTLPDRRYAIDVKNTNRLTIRGCTFTKVDSSAVYTQRAGYDGNLTRNFDFMFENNRVYAEPHAVRGRALIHALVLGGCNGAVVQNNAFHWCDDAISGSGTYTDGTQDESATYTDGTLGAVLRNGRAWTITGNQFYNSSEHAIYASVYHITVTGNTAVVDDPEICLGDFKFRSSKATVSGNTVVGTNGITLSELSREVTISGNTVELLANTSTLDQAGIGVSVNGISGWLDNRDWFTGYPVCDNITITGNTVKVPADEKRFGLRLYTDQVDANYPDGQLRNLTITGNTIAGGYASILVINDLIANATVSGNTLIGGDFDQAGFSAGTVMPSKAVFACYDRVLGVGMFSFTNNQVRGFDALFGMYPGRSGSGIRIASPITGNRFDYIKNTSEADFRAPDQLTGFCNNTGNNYLDRNFSLHMIGNFLGSGAGSDSYKRQTFLFDGTNLRFYTDDANNYIVL